MLSQLRDNFDNADSCAAAYGSVHAQRPFKTDIVKNRSRWALKLEG